jgi:hypothetical protein
LSSTSAQFGDCSGFEDRNKTVLFLAPKFQISSSILLPSKNTGITILGEEIYLFEKFGWLYLKNIGNLTTHMLSTVNCATCVSNCLECEPVKNLFLKNCLIN